MLRLLPIFLSLFAAAFIWQGIKDSELDPDEWTLYRTQYIHEGRVVEAAKGNITTTEGQGYAMVLATAFHDRATFDKLWQWTQANLRRKNDHLFSWRWLPGKVENPDEAIPDPNNATDGDILIAWALLRASKLWHAPDYETASITMVEDIKAHLILNVEGTTVLLPGMSGFHDDKKLVVNLSYLIFPAIDALAAASDEPAWRKLSYDGVKLIDRTAFGRWGLPPDWLALKPEIGVAEGYKPWFSYDAIRIPLYMIWGGKATAKNLKRYIAFWNTFTKSSFAPAWTDLINNAVDSYDASPGFKAIMALTRAKAAGVKIAPGALPKLTKDQSCYSASLLLLAKLAAMEAP